MLMYSYPNGWSVRCIASDWAFSWAAVIQPPGVGA
jgi:hypothetical protein